VAIVVDGVRIEGPVDPPARHLRTAAGQDLVASASNLNLPHQNILHGVGGAKAILEALRDIGLILSEDVAHMLGISVKVEGREANVTPDHIASLDDAREGGWNTTAKHVDASLKPGVVAELADLLPEPPNHVVSGGDSRDDGGRGKALSNDSPHGAHDVSEVGEHGIGPGGYEINTQEWLAATFGG